MTITKTKLLQWEEISMIISITKRIKLPSGKYKKRVKYSSVKYQIEKVKPLRSHYKLSSLHSAKYHLVRDI